jgi:DNA polymerase-1
LDAFTNSNQKWIAHNWKFDGAFLYHFIKKLPCHYADTMLMSYILKAEEKHDLKSLAFNYLNWPLESYESVLGQHDSFKNVPLDKAAFYGGSDAAATFRLYHLFQHQLDENPTLNKVFNQIDNPLVFILMHMELTGIQLDLELISTLEKELKDSLLKISQNIYHYAGTAFNINSPKQLRSLLFTTLQLPILRKTPKGDPSTDEDVLIDLKDSHPIISLILEYRQLEKLRSTYTFSLIQQIHAKTKRIHTNYHQTGTITGRLSSSSPNLQNIPIKSQYGRKIRQAFIAKPGYLLLSLDYSQIELRLMAHFSNDSNLLNAYNNQQDIHIRTASNLFDRPLATVTDQQRQLAKTVNFGLIYGMSAWGLAKQLHISREQAQAFIDSYFKQYPGVKTYMESMKTFAAEHGYVTTLSGRRIPIDIKSKNNPSQNAFRAAINGPLQGTASDLIKLAMLDIAKEIYSHQDEIELLLQVHDELIFEVKSEFAESWAKKICTLMESVLALNVPLKVNYQLHLNWGFVD